MTIPFHGRFSRDDLAVTFRGLGPGARFVRIGAMDGVTHDPIHNLVREFGWRGLLVEPMVDMFSALQKNYAECEGLSFENCAIADFEGHIEMARIDPASAKHGIFQDGAFGISTLMPDKGILGGKKISNEEWQIFLRYKQMVEVPCCRLEALLKKHRFDKIDLLLIDAEGADWMIARQLSLDIHLPRVVYLEFIHLSAYEQKACAEHFRNYGYHLYLDAHNAENFLAVHREQAGQLVSGERVA